MPVPTRMNSAYARSAQPIFRFRSIQRTLEHAIQLLFMLYAMLYCMRPYRMMFPSASNFPTTT